MRSTSKESASAKAEQLVPHVNLDIKVDFPCDSQSPSREVTIDVPHSGIRQIQDWPHLFARHQIQDQVHLHLLQRALLALVGVWRAWLGRHQLQAQVERGPPTLQLSKMIPCLRQLRSHLCHS